MILNQLILNNFGVYRGRHEFNLRPRGSGPIVIVGGKNGAGKTTLLEAIRLCLHGPLSLDEYSSRGVKQDDYKQYLRERIHRNANEQLPADWASVELEFEHAIAGEMYTYSVERRWEDNGSGVQETLQVRQNPEPSDKMTSKQWEDFIRGLFPPSLTQLFFFDGEKILALGNNSADVQQVALSRAVKSLLGLNFVEQLQADLNIYHRRRQNDNHVDVAQQRLVTLDNELVQLQSEEGNLLTQMKALDKQINVLKDSIQMQEFEIARVGGSFAQQRETNKGAQVRLRTDIEWTKQAIRDLCAGLLPFAITPVYTEAVTTQLLREADYQTWLASRSFIEQKLGEIQDEIVSQEFWQGTGAEVFFALQEAIADRVVQTLQRMVESPKNVVDIVLRHHASEPERGQLLGWVEESRTTVPDQLKKLTSQLVQLKAKLAQTESALLHVPADDVLGPLLEVLNECHQQLGGLTQDQLQLDESLHRLGLRREDLKRDLRNAREDAATRQKLAEKIRRVVDVQLVLDDFAVQLVQIRVSQLEEVFTRNFNQLCRKEHLLKRVEIDPQNFSVTLVGVGDEQMSQNVLSAGERQIYAIALLWALRQVSGRPLPVIIDAPLGRLDSDHRQNLVEHYFPHASQQVILFSTDTEVDSDFYAALQGHISHAYHLEYNQTRRATQVNPGYFWHSNGGETA